jgi:hypothetical protein
MEFLKIWLLCTIAAVIYGILHDQITARVCVEYFSMAHPTILPLTSPTLLGLEWGILATWWVGCGLGLLLATSARLGSLPSLSARDLSHSIRLLLLSMAFCALLAGITGFLLKCYLLTGTTGRGHSCIEARPIYGRCMGPSGFLFHWWLWRSCLMYSSLCSAQATCVKSGIVQVLCTVFATICTL